LAGFVRIRLAGEFGNCSGFVALESLEPAATVSIDRVADQLDRRRTREPTLRRPIHTAAESDRQLGPRIDVLAVDPDRGRSLEAEELGIVLARDVDHLDRDFDDALAQDSLEVTLRPFQVRAILYREKFDTKVRHAGSLQRAARTGGTVGFRLRSPTTRRVAAQAQVARSQGSMRTLRDASSRRLPSATARAASTIASPASILICNQVIWSVKV
jgi:hypothetical protein